jgi:hypothetical protein
MDLDIVYGISSTYNKMNSKFKVVDNFLPKQEFLELKNIMLSYNFPWYYNSDINIFHENKKDLTCQFSHIFFRDAVPSTYFILLKPILEKIECKALLRIKGNLYPRTDKIEIHKKHLDYDFIHKGALFYINTNNGKTILNDKTEIDSVENRMLFFESYKHHQSTSTNDQKARVNINFNYF